MNIISSIFKHILYRYWSYMSGAILLGILNILLTIVYKPWGVTAIFAKMGLGVWIYLGGKATESLHYYLNYTEKDFFTHQFWLSESSIMNLGVVFGSLASGILASTFRFKKIKSRRQLFQAIAGGLLMGYGARLSLGCNVGALINGISSQSMHGWIFAPFSFLGAFAGCMIIKKFLT